MLKENSKKKKKKEKMVGIPILIKCASKERST